jgi:uncharacterized protein (TIGR02145 family)
MNIIILHFRLILPCLFVCFSLIVNAQDVSNVRFEQVGKQIHIYYDLEGEGTYDISVYCSEDDGKSYGNELIYVTGAIGKDQIPDANKMIVWNVLKERENLSGNIRFKVVGLNKMKANLKNGQDVYDKSCIACHLKGVAGAPAIVDKDRWVQVAIKGINVLYQQTIAGHQGDYGVMPAKGTCSDCSNQDIFDAIGYLVYISGVITEEPIDWKLIGNNYLEIFDDSKLQINFGVFTDKRDKQIYKWVKIGKQIWMAENLNYKTSNSWQYDNNSTNGYIYGRLYAWAAATIACPSGWHLPDDEEWKTLEMHMGMSQNEADDTGFRGTNEGKKLKDISGWYSEGNGTNAVGFSALPGGYFRTNGYFYRLGSYGYWWSAAANGSANAKTRRLTYNTDDVHRNNNNKDYGFSVRCLRD